jgi:hypothetical protein
MHGHEEPMTIDPPWHAPLGQTMEITANNCNRYTKVLTQVDLGAANGAPPTMEPLGGPEFSTSTTKYWPALIYAYLYAENGQNYPYAQIVHI